MPESLTKLYLQDNTIQHIDQEDFKKTPNLKGINIE